MDPQDPFCPNVEYLASGKAVRVRRPNREDVVELPARVDALLPADHPARRVWQLVERLDLSAFYATIAAVVDAAGAPAIDPRLLVALWIYALMQKVLAAREVARRCVEDLGYVWLCGGVAVNAHTLSDFRGQHEVELEGLLTQVVQQMQTAGLVGLEVVAQDGMRVRASAGSGSFHRQATLEKHLEQACADCLAVMARPVEAANPRQQAAQVRAAYDRVRRLEAALKELPLAEAVKRASQRAQARVSETDPEARVMKMANGGFNPAWNWEYATDSWYGVIVGWDVSNQGSDRNATTPMVEQVAQRCSRLPDYWEIDGGFVDFPTFEALADQVTILAPVPKPKDEGRERYAPLPTDSPVIAAWRVRMGTKTMQVLYKLRAATAECVNAQARQQHGVQQVTLRGRAKVRCVMLWVALAHNLNVWMRQTQLCTPPHSIAQLYQTEGLAATA